MKTPQLVDTEMLTHVIDAIPFPVCVFDKNRTILYANKAAKEHQSLKTGDSLGKAKAHHFDNNEYFEANGDVRTGPTIIDRALKGEETKDLILGHRNKKTPLYEWIEIQCTPVMDKKGKFLYGILIYRDISERKRREDKLHFLLESTRILSLTMDFDARLERKAALAVPNLADWCSIEIMTEDGRLERRVLVHRDPQKIELIYDYERKYPSPPGHERMVERVMRTGKGEFIPVITPEMIDAVPDLTARQRKDLEGLQLSSIIILPVGTPGRVLGAFSVAYAESGRIYTEDDFNFFQEFSHHLSVLLDNARLYNEIRMRDLSKDAFLSSLSHELRNPLAPIKSALELLQLQNTDPKLEPDLGVIEHQFDHMAHLLNDLLDATRFIRGKIKAELAEIDLMQVLRDVARALESTATVKKVVFTMTSDAPEYPLFADRVRLEQAFTNLIGNALKFTPQKGSVSVEVRTDGDTVVVRIKDTGLGITEEEMLHIFEPYYQSERLQGENSGLGIGLRLVYEILQLHNGTILAHSEGPDKGSLFTITLPLAPVPLFDANIMDTAPTSKGIAKKVIIVDDNRAAADVMVRLLIALGLDAEAFYSGPEFLEYIKDAEPDVLFIDIGMPIMDGYAVIRSLRESGYTVPAVALTGYGFEEDKTKALEAGFTAHLTKPASAMQIRTLISELQEA